MMYPSVECPFAVSRLDAVLNSGCILCVPNEIAGIILIFCLSIAEKIARRQDYEGKRLSETAL